MIGALGAIGAVSSAMKGFKNAYDSMRTQASTPSGRGSAAAREVMDVATQNNAWSAKEAEKLRDWQEQQNKIAMDFNAAEAAKNRDWQELMSNTAHQREIKDLKAAGLNPILSAMGGNGAAVTSGATASGVTSAGAKGDVDMSASGAIASILASVLAAQTQLQAMNTNAITNLAVADKYTAMSKYTAELDAEARHYATDVGASTTLAGYRISAETALNTANINAAASRYVSDNNLRGSQAMAAATKISATLHSEASKYAADKAKEASRYSSDKNYFTARDIANIKLFFTKA